MSETFQTKRLIARPPEAADADAITTHFQAKDLAWMLARAPWPYTLSDAEGWIAALAKSRARGTEFGFVLEHADHGIVGSVGMSHREADIWEIGYWIAKPYWGQGYVTEAALGLLTWAKTVHTATRFVSGHIDDNPASGRVLIKLGFTLAGEMQMYVKGRDCEVLARRYVYGGAPVDVALKPIPH